MSLLVDAIKRLGNVTGLNIIPDVVAGDVRLSVLAVKRGVCGRPTRTGRPVDEGSVGIRTGPTHVRPRISAGGVIVDLRIDGTPQKEAWLAATT